MMKRLKTLLVLSVCSVFIVSGCTSKNNQSTNSYDYTAENEIISYQPINEDKRIITIGKYDSFDETPLEEALEEKFPDIDVVFVETLAGPNPVTYMKMQDEHNELTDISFCKVNIPDNDFLYDLAAENFLSKYNLSSLNALNINGKLFQIPTINSIHGIIYNKTLFQQHGWQVPQTIDEFYTLCEQISATGIRPFAVCTKYIEQLEWLGLGFSYDEIFANMEKQVQYNEFVQKNASSRNLLEPAFNVLKEFYHRGLIKDEDFSASITQYGYDLLNGDTAMLARNLDILSLPQEEGRDVELGFIGFPTNEAGNNWMEMISGTKISVAKKAMADDEKEKDILNILNYISSNDGQKTLQKMFSGISSLTSYQQESAYAFEEIQKCMETGHILYTNTYGSDNYIDVFKKWVKGELTIDEMIECNDNFETFNELDLLDVEPIAKAKQSFTVLQTSLYNADVMREKSDADIALMLNRTYFKGNMSSIYKGDIVYPERFCLKGVKAEDYLTTYLISGKNLKALMEHPIINGVEVNAMYAPSNLKMTYAPWADKNKNVKKLTLMNGKKIKDDTLYTVAAWAGTIDEKYITKTKEVFEHLGTNQDLMTNAMIESKEIEPVDSERIILDWEMK